MMDDERFLALVRAQRRIQQRLDFIGWMIVLIFVVVVITPVLKQFGVYDLLGIAAN